MPSEFLLMNVPHGNGMRKSLVMRVKDPYEVTWDLIFTYIEKVTGAPRRLFKGTSSTGGSIYGRNSSYPKFEYHKYIENQNLYMR